MTMYIKPITIDEFSGDNSKVVNTIVSGTSKTQHRKRITAIINLLEDTLIFQFSTYEGAQDFERFQDALDKYNEF